MKARVWLYVGLLGALALILPGGSAAQLCENGDATANVMLLLDSSGSMAWEGETVSNPRTRVQVLKDTLTGRAARVDNHDVYMPPLYADETGPFSVLENNLNTALVRVFRVKYSQSIYDADAAGPYFVFMNTTTAYRDDTDNDTVGAASSLDKVLREAGVGCIHFVGNYNISDDYPAGSRELWEPSATCPTGDPDYLAFKDALKTYFYYEESGTKARENGFFVVPVTYVPRNVTIPWTDRLGVQRKGLCYATANNCSSLTCFRTCYKPYDDPAAATVILYDDVGVTDAEEVEENKVDLNVWAAAAGAEAVCAAGTSEVWGDRPYSSWIWYPNTPSPDDNSPRSDGNTSTPRNLYTGCLATAPGAIPLARFLWQPDSFYQDAMAADLDNVTLADREPPPRDLTIGPEFFLSATGTGIDAHLRDVLGLAHPGNGAIDLTTPDFGGFFSLYYDYLVAPDEEGIMDLYQDVDYGLMVYDNLDPCADDDFPHCATGYQDGVGASHLFNVTAWADFPAYSSATDSRRENDLVQYYITLPNTLEPYGYTPIAAALHDLYRYFHNAPEMDGYPIVPSMEKDLGYPAPAMIEADHVIQDDMRHLFSCRRNYLIFITDGEQTSGEPLTAPISGPTPLQLAAIIARQVQWVNYLKDDNGSLPDPATQGVKLFVIGQNTYLSPAGVAQLEAMAAASDFPDDPDDLTTPFLAPGPAELRSALTDIMDIIMADGAEHPCPDDDGDGMPTIWEAFYDSCGLDMGSNDAAGDLDGDSLSNGNEYLAGADPCSPDTDGDSLGDAEEYYNYGTDPDDPDCDHDGSGDAVDCDPLDPNNFVSCLDCLDTDLDAAFTDCDRYVTILGPDCDDANANTWSTCATCNDGDTDTYFGLCNSYGGIAGPDCDDANDNAWDTCATCNDDDADSYFQLCNTYIGISGPDCSDANVNAWDTCATCNDSDADTWFELCNTYNGISGPDCNDADPAHWSDCSLCVDNDGDDRGPDCDLGPDCNDGDTNMWDTCPTCNDDDGDTHYELCNAYNGIAGPDCNDGDTNSWDTCATCHDVDGDSYYELCNTYNGILGPDCNDANENAWDTCPTCNDDDADSYYELCNTYNGILGPDCNDANENAWDTCPTCNDDDLDAHFELCNAYSGIAGPDCDDANTYAWDSCPTCNDDDADTWFESCDHYVAEAPPITVGTGTGSSNYPLFTTFHDVREQVIYLASEIGSAGTITALALDVSLIPGQTMENFTIRIKHTTLISYAPVSWEGPDSGWTTAYQADEPRGATGWRTFTLTTPFAYNGMDNLMVDFSFNNSSASGNGLSRYTDTGVSRAAVYSTNGFYNDPLDWTGTADPTPYSSNNIPNLRFSITISSINGPDCDDAVAVVYPGAAELCDAMDNQCPGDAGYGVIDEGCPVDSDGDGLMDDDEINLYFTDPGDPDSDDDGINDGDEVNVYNTLPTDWDSDGDYLPDGFEAGQMSGHSVGEDLDPLDAADGDTGFDGDGMLNAHEYWNGSDLWGDDPAPTPGYEVGCYYWGKSDGGIAVQPGDIVAMQKAYVGVSVDYSQVLPSRYDPMDLDRDMFPGPGDIVLAQQMYAGSSRPGGFLSAPTALTVTDAPAGPVAVGDTAHITVSVHAAGPAAEEFSPGMGVVFWVSSGNAVLLGGEGTDPGEAAGNRYDVSMKGSDGAPANIVVLITGPGPIIVNAKVPACGVAPLGRWCAEVGLAAPVEINP